LFWSSKQRCEFCDEAHKDHCPLNFKDHLPFQALLKKIRYDRDVEFLVKINPSAPCNLKLLENMTFETVNLSPEPTGMAAGKGKLNLYDCLRCFSQEETLTGNDKWYCSNCKTHQNAFKKMEIYRAPDYLIVHLKRFSHQRQSIFGSRKVGDLVNFPTQGLDLGEYVIAPDGGPFIYDLYAVSNHMGSLNGGHYTAFAQNPIN